MGPIRIAQKIRVALIIAFLSPALGAGEVEAQWVGGGNGAWVGGDWRLPPGATEMAVPVAPFAPGYPNYPGYGFPGFGMTRYGDGYAEGYANGYGDGYGRGFGNGFTGGYGNGFAGYSNGFAGVYGNGYPGPDYRGYMRPYPY